MRYESDADDFIEREYVTLFADIDDYLLRHDTDTLMSPLRALLRAFVTLIFRFTPPAFFVRMKEKTMRRGEAFGVMMMLLRCSINI